MLTTIFVGTCVAIQGIFVERLSNGLVAVRVGERIYTGRPVRAAATA